MFGMMGKLSARLTLLVAEDDGMSTAEYSATVFTPLQGRLHA